MSIQRPKSLTPRDNSEPFARPRRDVLKSYSISASANKYDIGRCSTFTLINPTSDATSSNYDPRLNQHRHLSRFPDPTWCRHLRSARDISKCRLREHFGPPIMEFNESYHYPNPIKI